MTLINILLVTIILCVILCIILLNNVQKKEFTIEKFNTNTPFNIGSSDNNIKIFKLPHENMIFDNKPVNKQNLTWKDTFRTLIDGKNLYVKRIDQNSGWGQLLKLNGKRRSGFWSWNNNECKFGENLQSGYPTKAVCENDNIYKNMNENAFKKEWKYYLDKDIQGLRPVNYERCKIDNIPKDNIYDLVSLKCNSEKSTMKLEFVANNKVKIYFKDGNKYKILSFLDYYNLPVTRSKVKKYRGKLNKTKSGYTCQNWTSQTPHRSRYIYPNQCVTANGNSKNNPCKKWVSRWNWCGDSYWHYTGGTNCKDAAKYDIENNLGNHNYCRNPDNSDTIWCYTTDRNKRWEYCDDYELKNDLFNERSTIKVNEGVKNEIIVDRRTMTPIFLDNNCNDCINEINKNYTLESEPIFTLVGTPGKFNIRLIGYNGRDYGLEVMNGYSQFNMDNDLGLAFVENSAGNDFTLPKKDLYHYKNETNVIGGYEDGSCVPVSDYTGYANLKECDTDKKNWVFKNSRCQKDENQIRDYYTEDQCITDNKKWLYNKEFSCYRKPINNNCIDIDRISTDNKCGLKNRKFCPTGKYCNKKGICIDSDAEQHDADNLNIPYSNITGACPSKSYYTQQECIKANRYSYNEQN